MSSYYKSLGLLHFVVLIFGFTGILGELISIGSTQLVWLRMLIAFFSMTIWLGFRGKLNEIFTKHSFTFLAVGFIIAAHWITFFQAIKTANVSIALVCLATSSLFTAILEPIIFKRPVKFSELILGAFVLAGIYLIFNFESNYIEGILFGLSSAFLASLFTVINGRLVKSHNSSVLSTVEMLGGFLGITLLLTFTGKLSLNLFEISQADWFYLILLGTICTAFAFIASVFVMRDLTPFTVSITINLEPIYGIILALIFFGESEKMGLGFYSGMILILSGVFLNAYLKRKARKKAEKALVVQPK
jgi:drug/metabolite transporter (DMT)-like permease